ncbi:oxysterol-binding protein 1-like isoform X2 [Ylistrum balloti]|uniref:oxysterol-binding protein 1-like isoform X2 n=1 Tax=Ylistrum balloti TaxID=509963 RepID=UPI002905A131|nr:oxysterol-binding protein 1-like isoform X2 [Ylistrum balloti]
MSESRPQHQSQYRGWLYKWTNYLRGYQKRWFVLQNGLLSYYRAWKHRSQAEMAHTCRGTINLANAFIHTEDSNTIVISNGGTQTFYLKATSEVERQKWVTALELAKNDAHSEPDSDEEEAPEPDKNELQNMLKTLASKLEDMNTCNDLISKHGSGLQRALTELETLNNTEDAGSKLKVVNERATMFRITSNAMINACSEYLESAQGQVKRLQKIVHFEQEQRMKLEEMVEQLAKDQVSLETQAKRSMHANVSDKKEMVPGSDEDDFFDALDYQANEFEVALPNKQPSHRTISDMSVDSQIIPEDRSSVSSDNDDDRDTQEARVYSHINTDGDTASQGSSKSVTKKCPERQLTSDSLGSRGTRRPVIPLKPNYSLNLWSIMKNCIGKELSKIPMPVNFNEPLSMLQRLTEDFEYSSILDKAGACEDSAEQLVHVAAFTISSFSTTVNRSTKPFNPLLGETYECDRMDDLGWRTIAEQVMHHPPTAAQYTEGKEWILWQEFSMTSKFRGKYLQVIPLGIAHLLFKKSGNHYTWRKVTTTVHNIIVGKLWVDHHGEMDITNHTNNDKCHLKYSAYSYFSREKPRKVTGVVTDAGGKAKWVLTGTWDRKMEGAQVLHVDESNKGKPMFETGAPFVIWERRLLPPGSERMYHFTRLAIELNEFEDGVAPTDCRRRPDQRLMEDGNWDEANKCKLRLEEKQRATRKRREAEAEEALKRGEEPEVHKPVWFEKKKDEATGSLIHTYNRKYWDCKEKQDWSMCPDIY